MPSAPCLGGLLIACLVLVPGCGESPAETGAGAEPPGEVASDPEAELSHPAASTDEPLTESPLPVEAPTGTGGPVSPSLPVSNVPEQAETGAQDPQAEGPEGSSQGSQASTGDPKEWIPLTVWEGREVETVRESHGNGKLARIRTVLPGIVGPDGFHGPEMAYHPNGALKLVKTWSLGRPEGNYRTWFPNGQVKRHGAFLAGELHGELREYWKGGTVKLEANYDNGLPHGRVAEYFADDRVMDETFWDYGSQIGSHRVWTKGEVLVLDEEYEDGKLHGFYRAFHPSTSGPRIEGAHAQGLKVGTWRMWAEDGSITLEETFVDGERTGTRSAYVGGVLVEKVELLNGVPNGLRQEFYEDGSPRTEGQLEMGKRTGPWSFWNPDGSLIEDLSGEYQDDRKVVQ